MSARGRGTVGVMAVACLVCGMLSSLTSMLLGKAFVGAAIFAGAAILAGAAIGGAMNLCSIVPLKDCM